MNTKSLKLCLRNELGIPLYLSDFAPDTTKQASFETGASISFSPTLAVYPSFNITTGANVEIEIPDTTMITYKGIFTSGSSDCTGRETNTFDNSGDTLYMGHDGVGGRRSWIPFMTNFSDLSAGTTWQGSWAGSSTYDAYDIINGSGVTYISKVADNFNNPPPDTDYWDVFPFPGVIWKDQWDSLVTYSKNDAVNFSGSSFISLQDSNTNNATSDTAWWDAWPNTGMHVVSAALKLTAKDSLSTPDNAYCKVMIACDTTISGCASWVPTTWSALKSKTYGSKTYTSGSAGFENWTAGDQYEIDVTDSIEQLLGANGLTTGITWTNGNSLATIMRNNGSTSGAYRTILSYEGASGTDYDPPILEIVYSNNVYSDPVLDTHIINSSATTPRYNNSGIAVGESNLTTSKSRGLLKFDLSVLPLVTSASATLYLYLESRKATNSRTMRAYQCQTNWDLYTATWNKRYGTKPWTTAGAVGVTTPIDIASGSCGSLALTTTMALGSKTITLTPTMILGWINSPLTNHGIMLKMDTESNDQYVFSSSQSTTVARRPKLIVNYTIGATTGSLVIQKTD